MNPLWIVVGLAAGLAALVHRRVIHADLLLPWFLAMIVLGLASTNPEFVDRVAALLGIEQGAIAIVFLTIFLLTGVAVTLAYSVSLLRRRQASVIRAFVARDLDLQEQQLAGRDRVPRA